MSQRKWAALIVIGLGFVSMAASRAGAADAAAPATGESEAPASDTGPQVTEGILKAPSADVWRVFSTPDGFKRLGPAQCEMDFRIGGLIRTHYDPKGVLGDDGTIENEILSYDPGRMVSFRIHAPPRRFPFSEETWRRTWTVVTLTDLGDGRTHVRIAGMGTTRTEESRKMRKFFESGNAWTLQRLQHEFDASFTAPARPAHAEPKLAPIAHERAISLPQSDVWSLLSTGEGWKRFLGADATIELRPGGRFEVLFRPESPRGQQGSEGCTVLSFVPGRMLSYTWNAPPRFEYARSRRTWVVVQLEEVSPARTRVRIDHQGFAEEAAQAPDHLAEWEEVRAYFQEAWPKVLGALEAQGSRP